MGPARSDAGATAGPGRSADSAILVLKVWREPRFRARITIDGPGSAPSAQTVLATTEQAVIEFVRKWLDAPQSPDL
jgi:hypothetical protein